MSEVEATIEEIRGILSEFERVFYERFKDPDNFTVCEMYDMMSKMQENIANSGHKMSLRIIHNVEGQLHAHNEAKKLKRREAASKQTGVQR